MYDVCNTHHTTIIVLPFSFGKSHPPHLPSTIPPCFNPPLSLSSQVEQRVLVKPPQQAVDPWIYNLDLASLLREYAHLTGSLADSARAMRQPLLQRDDRLLRSGLLKQARKDYQELKKYTKSLRPQVQKRQKMGVRVVPKKKKKVKKNKKNRKKIDDEEEEEEEEGDDGDDGGDLEDDEGGGQFLHTQDSFGGYESNESDDTSVGGAGGHIVDPTTGKGVTMPPEGVSPTKGGAKSKKGKPKNKGAGKKGMGKKVKKSAATPLLKEGSQQSLEGDDDDDDDDDEEGDEDAEEEGEEEGEEKNLQKMESNTLSDQQQDETSQQQQQQQQTVPPPLSSLTLPQGGHDLQSVSVPTGGVGVYELGPAVLLESWWPALPKHVPALPPNRSGKYSESARAILQAQANRDEAHAHIVTRMLSTSRNTVARIVTMLEQLGFPNLAVRQHSDYCRDRAGFTVNKTTQRRGYNPPATGTMVNIGANLVEMVHFKPYRLMQVTTR